MINSYMIRGGAIGLFLSMVGINVLDEPVKFFVSLICIIAIIELTTMRK